MSDDLSFEPFKYLSHPRFDVRLFRPTFIKAAWKVYSDDESNPISSQRFQVLFGDLFDSLFLDKYTEIAPLLDEIRKLFPHSEKLEHFFTDTFYIVLNHYIKSFYGTLHGWEKIMHFTAGIEEFIAYAAGHISDESLFLFEDTLIDALERLRSNNEPIMVLNTYYGVPIQYPARIVHTDVHSVTIKPHPIQMTAALLQNGIYLLKNGQLVSDVYASVNTVQLQGEQLLELKRFDQLETSLFHRQSVRVQPAHPYSFSILNSNLTLRFTLYDLSIGGIALTSKHQLSLPIQNDLTLTFPSEILGQANEVKGSLIFKSSYEGGYKYHFKIEPTLQQEDELSRYIARREQEIIKKLREEII